MKQLWSLAREPISLDKLWIFFTVGPVIVLILAIGVIPMGYAIWLSFHSKDPFMSTVDFVGFKNYITLFTNPKFLAFLGRSLQIHCFFCCFSNTDGVGDCPVIYAAVSREVACSDSDLPALPYSNSSCRAYLQLAS